MLCTFLWPESWFGLDRKFAFNWPKPQPAKIGQMPLFQADLGSTSEIIWVNTLGFCVI
jgi:hypothetical protein